MKHFDDFEKEIINRIVVSHKKQQIVSLSVIIDSYLTDINIQFVNNNEIILKIDEDFNSISVVAFEKAMIISRFVLLLEYLEKHDYIYIFEEANDNDKPKSFGGLIEGHKSIDYKIADRRIVDFLLANSFKTIVIRQTLIDFYENKFMTLDEIIHLENMKEASKQLLVARRTMSLSALSVILACIAVVVTLLK